MKRREFIVGSGLLIGAAFVPGAAAAASGDEESVKQLVRDYYSEYFVIREKKKYRELLTDDYLLLENGELIDADADIAAMPAAISSALTTSTFDR